MGGDGLNRNRDNEQDRLIWCHYGLVDVWPNPRSADAVKRRTANGKSYHSSEKPHSPEDRPKRSVVHENLTVVAVPPRAFRFVCSTRNHVRSNGVVSVEPSTGIGERQCTSHAMIASSPPSPSDADLTSRLLHTSSLYRRRTKTYFWFQAAPKAHLHELERNELWNEDHWHRYEQLDIDILWWILLDK